MKLCILILVGWMAIQKGPDNKKRKHICCYCFLLTDTMIITMEYACSKTNRSIEKSFLILDNSRTWICSKYFQLWFWIFWIISILALKILLIIQFSFQSEKREKKLIFLLTEVWWCDVCHDMTSDNESQRLCWVVIMEYWLSSSVSWDALDASGHWSQLDTGPGHPVSDNQLELIIGGWVLPLARGYSLHNLFSHLCFIINQKVRT